MKTATIFLVSVTVFVSLLQQSSAAPADLGWDSLDSFFEKALEEAGKVLDGIKETFNGVTDGGSKGTNAETRHKNIENLNKLIQKLIESSNAKLTHLAKLIKKALEKATGVEKEGLIVVYEWTNDFGVLVASVHKQLISAYTQQALEHVIIVLEKAIIDIEADWAKISENLTSEVKDILGDLVLGIVENGKTALEAIINFLSGKGVNAETGDKVIENLSKLIQKLIESSNAKLTHLAKLIKKALEKATGVEKEGLIVVYEWTNDFGVLVASVHKQLISAYTQQALEHVIIVLEKAIIDIEADWAKISENLTSEVKDILGDLVLGIVENGKTALEAIINFLSGKGVNAETRDKVIEKLNNLIQKLIESSNAKLTHLAKLIKKALEKATGVEKEGLIVVYEWTNDFGVLVASVHKQLISAYTQQALEHVIIVLEKAIIDIEADWAKISENLTSEVKDILGDLVLGIVENGKTALEAIINFLSGKGVNAETGDKVIENLSKLIQKLIESSNAKLTHLAKLIKKALEKATGVEKEGLIVVYEWTNDFGVLVASVHKQLISANTQQALADVIIVLEKAIIDIEADWAKISENLTSEVKDILGDLVLGIVENGKTALEAIINFLSGKGVNAETRDKVIEKLNKLIQKLIESSNAKLTHLAKLIKKALEKATGVEKEGLIVVYEWTNDFEVLVASVHKQLISANTQQALEDVIIVLEKAIIDIEADWAKISEKLTSEVKDILGDLVLGIVENGKTALEAIINFLSGKGVNTETRDKVIEKLNKLIQKLIESSNAKLTHLAKLIKKALEKATGVEKEGLIVVYEWTNDFGVLVASVHKQLISANTQQALKDVIIVLEKAIIDIEADWAKISENLTSEVKDILGDLVLGIVENGKTALEAIINFLSGKGVNAETGDKVIEKLNKLIQKLIESSNAKLTHLAKLIKKALEKATGVEKEGLIVVYEWTNDFGVLVASVHKQLISANTQQALEDVIIILEKAIIDIEADWAKISENLTSEVKDILGDLVLGIVENGKTALEAIINFLSGKGVNAETGDKVIEKLNKLIQKLIESSNAKLTHLAKLIKKALEKATGVEKEGLIVVYEWTNDFEVLVASVHKQLISANTQQALEDVIIVLEKAIIDIEADWAKISENLTSEVKDILGGLVLGIVENGKTALEAIIHFLTGQ